MNQICRNCGTELQAGTSFCRQCGSQIVAGGTADRSEQPTSLFPDTNNTTTQRLDPRPTSEPGKTPYVAGPPVSQPLNVSRKKPWKPVLALTVVCLVIACILAVVAISRIRTHSRTTSAEGLFYPGAQTVVDITSADGGRALHLQTSDPLEKVEDWYEKSLQPQKTVRLTSSSVVLKNENTTATIASEGTTTSILIKMKR